MLKGLLFFFIILFFVFREDSQLVQIGWTSIQEIGAADHKKSIAWWRLKKVGLYFFL